MFTKTVTYTDFNGEERTETLYFNLSKSEIMEMELSTEGGMTERLNTIVAAKNGPEIVKTFKDIILKAYAVKSPDGKRLIKSEELSTAFSQTPAYDDLFFEMLQDPNAASNFINSIIPKIDEKSFKAPVNK